MSEKANEQASVDDLRDRCMLFMVDEDDVLNVIRLADDLRRVAEGQGMLTLQVPELHDVPQGASIRGVYYEHHTRCFAFRVHHASFAEVPLGRMIPTAGPGLNFKRFAVRFSNGEAQVQQEVPGPLGTDNGEEKEDN